VEALPGFRRALCGARGVASSGAWRRRAECRKAGVPFDFQSAHGRSGDLQMKYVCLVYVEPAVFRALPEAERAEVDRDSPAYDRALAERGHYIVAAALQPVATAKTVRKRGGKLQVTDGPFAETKEVLAGFIFLEAKDMDEAVRLAGEIPMARVGSVEVRAELTFGD